MSTRTDPGQKKRVAGQSGPKDGNRLDIAGIFTATLPILATGILFMVGWAYISNWYAFFGIDVEQLNIPPQEILIQSLPVLLYLVTYSVICALLYFYAKTTLQFLRRKKDFSVFNRPTQADLLIVLTLTLAVINVFQVSRYLSLSYTLEFIPPETYVLFLIEGLSLYLAFFFVISLRTRKYSPTFLPAFKKWLLMLLFPAALLIAISFSATLGISQAAKGNKIAGRPISQVYLVSPRPVGALKGMEQSCDADKNCVYGVFGFIAENANSFFLIKWKTAGQASFSRDPGLYIIPRSDQAGAYFIIPVSPSPLPIITQTPVRLTPQAAPTATLTLPAIIATSTP